MRRLCVEQLEDRFTPASVDLAGGVMTFVGGPAINNVTQSVNGTSLAIYDSADLISVSAAAFDAGWRGGGTHTAGGPRASVSSEVFDLGSNGDKFSLRANDVSVSIMHTAAVYISSNAPTNTGHLHDIHGTVTIGPDSTSLWVSNQSTTYGDSNVILDSSGIHNFAGQSNDVDILFGTGAFNLIRLTGSSSVPLAESFMLAGSPGPVQVYANAGNDTVHVTADVSGLIRMGAGDDTVTVDAGVTFTGDVYGDSGEDAFNFNFEGFGTVTGSVIQ